MTLAIETYHNADLTDGEHELNLSWTIDERATLMPELAEFIRQCQDALGQHLSWYPVDDPYGEEVLICPISTALGVEPDQISITAGAGVGGLIHSLAARLAGQRVSVVSDIYPDFPEWLSRFGGSAERVNLWQIGSTDTVFFERPSLMGNALTDELDVVATLCSTSPSCSIIIDESNANYLPWNNSSAQLCRDFPNLTVLRGLSKGYGMGSLRLGIAICHEERATDLRRHLPALQVASNAIEFGRKLLSAPESLLTRLHRRIAQAKTEGLAALASAAIPEPVLPHSALPYFFFDFEHISEHRDAVLLLAQYGIKGKNHVIWNGGQRTLRRYSVPLSDERVTRFRELLGAARK